MPSSKATKIALIGFCLIWILFSCEMFFRIFKPWPILPRYVESGDFGIRVNMPNEQYVHKSKDYTVNIRTNNKGVRADNAIPYEKPNGVKRIVVLGDSFGIGYGVNLEDTFTQVLKNKLESKTGQKYQIVNLSVSGFSTAEQLIMLQNEGMKYAPDFVLSTWHYKDPPENKASQLFKLVDGVLVRDREYYLLGMKQREMLYQYPGFKFIAENSHFYNWARERAANNFKKALRFFRKLKNFSADDNILDVVESNPAPKNQLTLALIKQIKVTAESGNAQHLLLNIPVRKSRTVFEDRLPAEIESSFKVVNPISSFRKHPNRLIYWENSHGHFTPFGCELVAQEIAERILNN